MLRYLLDINVEVKENVTILCHQCMRWFVKPRNWMRPPCEKVWMRKKMSAALAVRPDNI